MTIIIATSPKPYNIEIKPGTVMTNNFCKTIAENYRQTAVITDNNIAKLYLQDFCNHLNKHTHLIHYTIPAGEQHKNRETKANIEDFLQRNNFCKDSLLIAFGGGVITDITGFVAATYLRGVKVVYIPTTMLAMTDAAIGGKTGINTKFAKNQIGTISSPNAVYIDPAFLKTQAKQQWLDGWSETLKHALLQNKTELEIAFNYYQQKTLNPEELLTIIKNSCNVKNSIVNQDPHEKHIRKSLNIGHSIGHSIETSYNYQVSHGQAVALGIICEAYISYEMGIMTKNTFKLITYYFKELAKKLPHALDDNNFFENLKYDKKNSGSHIKMCLLKDVGSVYNLQDYTTNITNKHLKKCLDFINNEFISTNSAKQA